MGNKVPLPIIDQEEAQSRWNSDDLAKLKQTFETYARIQSKDKMSKSAFQNYAFPFLPKELVERLFVVFQLQLMDDTLKSNYKRNARIGAKYKTNTRFKSKSNALTMNLQKPEQNNEKKENALSSNKMIMTKNDKKKKKIPTPKVGIAPFLSFTISFDQFLIGITIIMHGTQKEKLLLLWRMFDIKHSDNLSYYDMEHILNILIGLETNFFNKNIEEVLYDLFMFKLPSDDTTKMAKVYSEDNDNDNDMNEEEKQGNTEDTHKGNGIKQEEEKKVMEGTSVSISIDFNIHELIECKLQDVAKTRNGLGNRERIESKTDEKATLLTNDNMNYGTDGKEDAKSNNVQSMDELEQLKQNKMCFEHFYEWCKQYGNDNPFTSWLCTTFPPPPIQVLPDTFSVLWKELYIAKTDRVLHEEYGYLCTECDDIYAMAHRTNFSVSEVIKMYCAWFNTEDIYQYNCGYFLTLEQFCNVFEQYITDQSYIEIVFKVMDQDKDEHITLGDVVYTLSILMQRITDEDKVNTMNDVFHSISNEESKDIVFEGLQRYALIEFGIHPLPDEQSLEFEIILSILKQHNDELAQYEEPEFEEYGDYYYLISTIWWSKWCDKVHIKASYKSDGRLVSVLYDESEEYKYEDESSKLGPMDNTSLILSYTNDEYVVKADLVSHVDYIGVSPSMWSVLTKWYNGGPGIRRSIIGKYDEEYKKHIAFLQVYPLRVHIHSKTSPELLDNQREVLENIKLERDYKASEKNGNADNIAKEVQNASLLKRASSLFDYRQAVVSTGASRMGMDSKIDHVYNGNYYEWDLLVSAETSFDYMKQIMLKYDPLLSTMQIEDSEYKMNENKMRFWWLHNEKSLVIEQDNRMKIKILNTSPSYEQFVKMKKNANGRLSALFKKKKKKKKIKKKKNKYISAVPKSKAPVLFAGNELIINTDISNNNYIYVEIQSGKGQWEGVQLPDDAQDEDEDEDESSQDTQDVDTTNDGKTNEDQDQDEDVVESNDNNVENKEHIDDNVLSHGVVGLQNLGNTCFLNAAVQCLSHSLPFQQYLLSKVFINEINTTNFLGNGGRIPIAFAALIRALYSSSPYSIHSPRNLRSLIQELNPMFEGNLQHDSQEALQFLLQGVHQDLNRIKEKPRGLECKDSGGRRDEIVAKEAWNIFTATDQSVIVDLFMGQYRSTITCLTCKRQNHKFDAYQMLSLPIPIVDSKFVHVIVHFRSPIRKPIKYSFKLPDSTTIQDIIDKVGGIVLIAPCLLIPTHIVKNSIYQIITLNKQITNINLTDMIILFEAPQWHVLTRPSMGILETPIGFKIGTHFDIKDRMNHKWYHGQIVDLCHTSLWNENRRNRVYIEYEKGKKEKEEKEKEKETKQIKKEKEEEDLRGLWKMKIHYVGWKDIWDEWIDCCDDLRINKAGTHCRDVPSEIKYPPLFPSIPYHVITIRCMHRRIVETKATFWEGRGYQIRTFGTPLLLFLPRNGITSFELYHYLWNFITLRYLNPFNAYFTSSTNTTTAKQKEYDTLNAICNAYIHIFGGLVFNNKGGTFKEISPPFILRRVDRFGIKCSQSHWDAYSIGNTIALDADQDEILALNDGEYIAMDWNEACFSTFFENNQDNDDKDEEEKEKKVSKVDDNKSTAYLNNMSLLFDELLDDVTVIKHFAQFNKPISIGDCIREFQKEEKLSEYFCEKCNKKIDATKSLRIWSTPPILIFHFKRTGNFGRKIDTNVDYLLNNFDVAPFLVPRTMDANDVKEEEEEEEITDHHEWSQYPVVSSKQTHYNLFAAINHYGVAGGGHYIANCLCKDVNSQKGDKKETETETETETEDDPNSLLKWYLFDDHRVTTVSPLDVKSKHAYLLFYIRSDIQELFLQHLVNKSKENQENQEKQEKLFDIDHIHPDQHFQFLPQNVRKLIGEELNDEQIKLLNSEGVETTTNQQCDCVIL